MFEYLLLLLLSVSLLGAQGVDAKTPKKNTEQSAPAAESVKSVREIAHLLRSHEFETAIEQVETYRTSGTRTPREDAIAHLLAAYAAVRLGDGARAETALNALKRAGAHPETLHPDFVLFTHFIEAETARLLGDHKTAQAGYRALIDASRPLFRVHALTQAISLFEADHAFREAKSMIERARALEPSTFSTPEWTFRLAQAAYDAGDKSDAKQLLTSLYINTPGSSDDREIERLLVAIATGHDARDGHATAHTLNEALPFITTAQWTTRFDRALAAGFGDLAQTALEVLIVRGVFDADTAAFKTAEVAFKQRDYARAKTLFAEYEASSKNPAQRQKALMMQATSTARSGDLDGAIRVNERVIQRAPQSAEAHWARYKIAFLHFDKGDDASALRHFEGVVSGGFRPTLDESLWYAGWSAYRLKQFDQAVLFWKRLAELDKKQTYRALYWQARALDQSGNKDAARATYRALADGARFDYYGFLALLRLEGHAPSSDWTMIPKKSGWFQSVPSALREWTLEAPKTLDIVDFGVSSDLSSETSERSARFFIYFGIDEAIAQSVAAVERVVEARLASPNASRESIVRDLALVWESGDYAEMGSWVDRNRDRLSRVFPDFSSQRFQFSYPRAWRFDVVRSASRLHVPEALVYAIMRQESGFRPEIRSPANAVGLMQLIPKTALQVATDLKWESFKLSELTNPKTNIAMGTYYVHFLQDEVGGLPFVIAAYNAGPEAVLRWKKSEGFSPDDWEAFVESIPYGETNTYVKRVLANYWMYRGLYGL